jgi:hypothetical protein
MNPLKHGILFLFCSLGLGAQSFTFSPQYTYGDLTLWEVDASGSKGEIPAQQIWAVAASHKLGHVDQSLIPSLVTKVQGKSLWAIIEKACTIAGTGTAIGAYIKAQQNWSENKTAQNIAIGATAIAGVSGLLLPTIINQAPKAPPVMSLIGNELAVGSSGAGSGWFWSLQNGEAFTAEVQ